MKQQSTQKKLKNGNGGDVCTTEPTGEGRHGPHYSVWGAGFSLDDELYEKCQEWTRLGRGLALLPSAQHISIWTLCRDLRARQNLSVEEYEFCVMQCGRAAASSGTRTGHKFSTELMSLSLETFLERLALHVADSAPIPGDDHDLHDLFVEAIPSIVSAVNFRHAQGLMAMQHCEEAMDWFEQLRSIPPPPVCGRPFEDFVPNPCSAEAFEEAYNGSEPEKTGGE